MAVDDEWPEIPAQPTETITTGLRLEIVADDVRWEHGAERLNHPDEVQTLILNENDAEKRLDLLVRFPPGYESPTHSHPAAHSIMILAGSMHFDDGTILRAGDYMYGQKEPHGMRFPDGCTVFVSFVGGSPAHEWDDEEPGVK